MLVVIKVVDFDVVEDEGLATVLALVVLNTRLVVVIADVSVKGKVVSKLGLNDMVVTSFVEVGKVGLTDVLCGVVVSTVDNIVDVARVEDEDDTKFVVELGVFNFVVERDVGNVVV